MKAIAEVRRLSLAVVSLVLLSLVYLLPATTAQAASESTLYDFNRKGNSGGNPSAVLRMGGDLYGTTDFSGNAGWGTVYRVTQSGHYKLIHDFASTAMVSVFPETLIDVAGILYGATYFGPDTGCGGYGCGVIYSLTPSGVYNVLYSFQGLSDGYQPTSLIYLNGLFYGVAAEGGSSSCRCGTVFSLTPQGVLTTVYEFQGGQDGAFPDSLTEVGGVLYGTTGAGGGKCGGGHGCGTIFSITLQGVENVVHRFENRKFGTYPNGPLLNLGGVLYGTTLEGGTAYGGTVFRLTLDGHYKVLHSFSYSVSDGNEPSGGLTRIGSTLYGTTGGGGSMSFGTVFSITTHGAESIVHSFEGSDGSYPSATLVSSHGVVYGTTTNGGTGQNSGGGLFEVTP